MTATKRGTKKGCGKESSHLWEGCRDSKVGRGEPTFRKRKKVKKVS